jgi:MFS-type transporter involved in bile tolerance (Atg22 family)
LGSKCAGLLRPFVFAVFASIFGSSRLSIMALIVCYFVGGLILSRVDEEEGLRGVGGRRQASCQRRSLKGTEHV